MTSETILSCYPWTMDQFAFNIPALESVTRFIDEVSFLIIFYLLSMSSFHSAGLVDRPGKVDKCKILIKRKSIHLLLLLGVRLCCLKLSVPYFFSLSRTRLLSPLRLTRLLLVSSLGLLSLLVSSRARFSLRDSSSRTLHSPLSASRPLGGRSRMTTSGDGGLLRDSSSSLLPLSSSSPLRRRSASSSCRPRLLPSYRDLVSYLGLSCSATSTSLLRCFRSPSFSSTTSSLFLLLLSLAIALLLLLLLLSFEYGL